MLEAVHTIHKHGSVPVAPVVTYFAVDNLFMSLIQECFCLFHAGIVHSDLKPANFVIVNASLKLIDFGIANSLQADVTSIMKDSQVMFYPDKQACKVE